MDVEGLRAVAILGVVASHAGIPFLRGGYVGVDVFFVISGFVITRMLIAELDDSGTISLWRFYARRVRRLLPLAATVLVTVSVLALLIMGPGRRAQLGGDVVAASLFFINWRFGAQAVNYFGASVNASPIMHFWSLSVEEQFYIFWPGLLLAATWWRRRRGGSLTAPLWILVCAIGVGSLVYGIHETQVASSAGVHQGNGNETGIYFSTLARGWELALGCALALAGDRLSRVPRRVGEALGLVGAGAIVVSMLAYTDTTPFPGVAALLPTLGAAAIIGGGRTGPLPVLTVAPVRYIGRISYSWYLWHWPMIVFAGVLWGTLSPLAGSAVVLVSLVPTVISHHLIEQPIRRARAPVLRPRLAIAAGATAAAVVVGVGSVVGISSQWGAAAQAAPRSAVRFVALDHGSHRIQQRAKNVRPAPAYAANDKGRIYADGCAVPYGATQSPPCIYGDKRSHTTIVLFGDSHAEQYGPALIPAASRHGWRVVALIKQGCSPTEISQFSRCNQWRQYALRRIARTKPALVVMSSLIYRHPSHSTLLKGYVDVLRRLRAMGEHVVVIRDGPRPPQDIPDCVAQNLQHLANCAFPLQANLEPPIDVQAVQQVPGVHLINPIPLRCLPTICPAVIGNVLVYRSGTHISATYAATLTDWMGRQIHQQLTNPWRG